MLKIFICSLLCIPNLCFAQDLDTVILYELRYDNEHIYIQYPYNSRKAVHYNSSENKAYRYIFMLQENDNGYLMVFKNNLLIKEGGIEIEMMGENHYIEAVYSMDAEIIHYRKYYKDIQVKNTGIWLEHNGQSTAIKTYFEGNIISEKNIKLKNYPRKMEDYEVLFKNIGVR